MIKKLLLCFTSITSAFAQGPIDGYLKGPGNLDFALGINYLESKKYLGSENKIYDLPYSVEMLSFFGQYGLSKKVDAVATVPLIFGDFENKFQDMGLFLKYRPLYKELNKYLSFGAILSGGFSFPLSDYSPDVSGAIGQRAKSIPLRLVTQFDIDPGLFLNFTGTYNFRLDKLSPETINSITVSNSSFIPSNPDNSGLFLIRFGMATRHHFAEIILERQKTFGGVNYVPDVPQPTQLYGVDYTKIGATYYFGSQKNGIALNASYITKGRNIGTIFSLGISFILKFENG